MKKFATMVALLLALSRNSAGQTASELYSFFKDRIGLSEDQISMIAKGKPFAKVLPTNKTSELLVFGGVFVKGSPSEYVQLAFDMDRLRRSPSYMGAGRIQSPPHQSDLEGFTLEPEDIWHLRSCKPGKCGVMLPADAMAELHAAANVVPPAQAKLQVNEKTRDMAMRIVSAYQREGNRALPVYRDAVDAFDVNAQLIAFLARPEALPLTAPNLRPYLLDYPKVNPPNLQTLFFWEKVDFGLKTTLRLNHAIAYRVDQGKDATQFVAVKQLYASHYLQLALDLTACVPAVAPGNVRGFYLLTLKGSTQQGLTGFTGSILKRIIMSRTRSSQERLLANIKHTIELGK